MPPVTSFWNRPVTEVSLSAFPQRLADAYARIHRERMADMPFCNPALTVEVVEFRPWQSLQVGILITPWMINMILAPVRTDVATDEASLFQPLGPDQHHTWGFPAGEYDFMGWTEPECGPFHFCSLFSPTFEFGDQATAKETANLIMNSLFTPPVEAMEAGKLAEREAAHLQGRQAAVSRRAFITGGRAA